MPGLLSYALAGGVKGAADVTGDILKEERKSEAAEQAEIRKEGRQQDIWTKRQQRLDEIKKGQIDYQEERVRKRPQKLGYGDVLVEGDTGTEIARGQDKPSDGTDSEIKNEKYFKDYAKDLYKVSDMETIDANTRNSIARLSAVSTRLHAKHPQIDRNTIMLRSYEYVDKNPSLDVQEIVDEIESVNKGVFDSWILTDAEEQKIKDLIAKQTKAERDKYSGRIPELGPEDTGQAPAPQPGQTEKPKGGMLSQPIEQPADQGAPPANMLKEGVATTFENGQVWRLENGKPIRVK